MTAEPKRPRGRPRKEAAVAPAAAGDIESTIVRRDLAAWFELHGCVIDKARQHLRAPELKANKLQAEIAEIIKVCRRDGRPPRIVTLKGRQQGSSTISVGAAVHELRGRNAKCCIIGDEFEKSVKNLVKMFRDFVKEDRFQWGNTFTETSGKFSHGSELVTETANDPRAGASGTIQVLIATEVAHWKETGIISAAKTFAALLNCVPELPDTLVIVESTPNGASGVYFETYSGAITLADYLAGRIPENWNGYFKVAYFWHEHPEYDLPVSEDEAGNIMRSLTAREQELLEELKLPVSRLAWRRKTLKSPKFNGDEDKFEEEYPADEVRCLTADSRVGTSRGMVRIEDVEVGAECDHGWIAAKEMTGVKPVFRITTRNGYTLRATGNHRVAVGDGFVPCADLVGRKVVLQVPVLASEEHVERWTGFAGVERALRITEEWGAFLGYFAGDGSFGGEQLSMVMDKRDEDVVERIADLVEMVSGRKPGRRLSGEKKGGMEIRVSDKRFREVFEQLGLLREGSCGQTLRKVCVPECIWRSPKAVVRQFLRYLFEADGWASPLVSKVLFFTKHLEFARDVQRLLLAFGVRSGIRHVVKTTKAGKFPGVQLSLSSIDSAKFITEIGFVSERKKAGAAAKYQPKGKVLERYDFEDEVISVEPDGIEPVWDIQIQGERHAFGANGILVHNCFLMSGRRAFPVPMIQVMKKEARAVPPPVFGDLSWGNELRKLPTWRLCGEDDARVKVWEAPRAGCRYILPVDPMTGASQTVGKDPDNHGACIIRCGGWSQGRWFPPAMVARLADCFAEKREGKVVCRWDIDVLAAIVAQLSRWYGGATIIPEMNMDRGLVELLKPMGMNIYRRVQFNKTRQKQEEALGWMTTPMTRGAIIENLKRAVRLTGEPGEGLAVWDLLVLREFETMIVTASGKAEASGGAHDDQVMTLAIGMANLDSAVTMAAPKLKGGRRYDDDDEGGRPDNMGLT